MLSHQLQLQVNQLPSSVALSVDMWLHYPTGNIRTPSPRCPRLHLQLLESQLISINCVLSALARAGTELRAWCGAVGLLVRVRNAQWPQWPGDAMWGLGGGWGVVSLVVSDGFSDGFLQTSNLYLVGGFKHFSIIYGCHPSHWRTHIF